MEVVNKCCSSLSCVEHSVAVGLEKWGRIIARNPWSVFWSSLATFLICCGGFGRLRSETETENLWTPIGAQVVKDKDLYSQMFGTGFRIHTMYFKDKGKENGNVLTINHFKEMHEFDTKLRRDLTVCVDDVTYNFTSLCARARPTDNFCLAGGNPLEFMYNIETHRFDFTGITTDEQLLAKINLAKIVFTPEGSKDSYELDISGRHKLMSNIARDQNGRITFAETLKMTWFGSRNNDTNQNDNRCYDCDSGKGTKGCNPTLVWEKKFVEEANEWNKNSKYLFAHVQAESSVGEALGGVILGDVAKLNISFVVIIVYSILVLGKMSSTSVAVAGVVSVGNYFSKVFSAVTLPSMSIGATYGLMGYCGVPLTPVTNVLPFILIGIGVDDMFVLCGALDRAPRHLSLEDRIGYMMRTSGTSITLTSLTDCLAFAVGTTTSFPALKYFCIYAAVGVMFDFWFQISIFVSWLEKERDCFCCAMCCCPKRDGNCKCCFVEDEKQDLCCYYEGGILRECVSRYYTPAIGNNIVKAVVIAIFFGFFGFGLWATPKLSENFSLRFFVPMDHPLQKTFDIADKEFNNKNGISIDVMLDHRFQNEKAYYLHSDMTRQEVPKIESALRKFEWTLEDTIMSPLKNFSLYIEEAKDAFPMSPHHFWVPDMPTFAQLTERKRNITLRGITVFPDTLAEDCSPTGSALNFCPATEPEKQGGISKGTWPRLRKADYIKNHDKLKTELAHFTDTKLFYDVFHHWIGTPQGASMRGYLSLHDWYLNFTDWIEWMPETRNDLGEGLVLDKTRVHNNGFLNGVHNGTRRPKQPENFCALLKYFMKTTDPKFVGKFNNGSLSEINPPLNANDPKCYPPGGEIRFSKLNAEMKCKLNLDEPCELANATQEVVVMTGVRAVVSEVKSPMKPIPYSFTWLFTEQYNIVRREAYSNIIAAIVSTFVITIFFLNHFFCAFLVCFNVTMVLVDLVALMWAWNVSINSVSIINLVLAIGLAVDYSAHVAHAFMSATGDRNQRATKAMQEMGPDVIHGALSTFLAVLVLSTSKSYIFQAMFKQFFGICIFGALHGLVLLPVVLSIIGPPTNKKEEEWVNKSDKPEDATSPETITLGESSKAPVSVNNMSIGDVAFSQRNPEVVEVPSLDMGEIRR